MATPPQPIDLGGFYYGEYVVFDLHFLRSGAAQNPGTGPFCKLTPPGGVETDYSAQIVAQGSEGFQFIPVTTVPGFWTGRIYATGAGQTSRDIVYDVGETLNP